MNRFLPLPCILHVAPRSSSPPYPDPMASRLLVRCTRLLSRASPQAAVATSSWTNHIAATTVSDLQWAPTWAWVPERPLCNVRNIATNGNVYEGTTTTTELEKRVAEATTPEDILQAWEKHRGNGDQAAIALVKLARLVKGTSAADRLSDPRLQDMMETMKRQVRNNACLVLAFHRKNQPLFLFIFHYRYL